VSFHPGHEITFARAPWLVGHVATPVRDHRRDPYGHLMGDEDDRSRSVIEDALGKF